MLNILPIRVVVASIRMRECVILPYHRPKINVYASFCPQHPSLSCCWGCATLYQRTIKTIVALGLLVYLLMVYSLIPMDYRIRHINRTVNRQPTSQPTNQPSYTKKWSTSQISHQACKMTKQPNNQPAKQTKCVRVCACVCVRRPGN